MTVQTASVRGIIGGRRKGLVATRRQRKPKSELEGARGLPQWIAVYQAYNAIFKVAELSLLQQRISLPQLHLLAILKKGAGSSLPAR